MHVLLYHDCLNEIGYKKLEVLTREENEPDEYILKTAKDVNGRAKGDFCATQDSEIIPEICNEFILSYCKQRKTYLALPKQQKLVRMTERLCSWLYEEGFTTRRLLKRGKS